MYVGDLGTQIDIWFGTFVAYGNLDTWLGTLLPRWYIYNCNWHLISTWIFMFLKRTFLIEVLLNPFHNIFSYFESSRTICCIGFFYSIVLSSLWSVFNFLDCCKASNKCWFSFRNFPYLKSRKVCKYHSFKCLNKLYPVQNLKSIDSK